jgi:hypothetical protein
MRPIGTIAVGLALVSGAAGAQAQTVISRQITSEPVETVVTQSPNGTAVTRRILPPEPGVTSYMAPPPGYAPAGGEAIESQYYVEPAPPAVTTRREVEPAAPAATTRRATSSRPTTVGISSTRAPARARTETARRVSPPPPAVRTVTRTVVLPPPDPALVLSPAQREVLYRTIVQHEFYPAPAPAPLAAGVYGDYAYDPAYDQGYRDPYHPAYRWDGVPLTVGVRVPPSLPLYGVPETVALRIPAVEPYNYAVVNDRGYLVDPATGVIVAEIAP